MSRPTLLMESIKKWAGMDVFILSQIGVEVKKKGEGRDFVEYL